ncbi:MAG: DUF4912 domain-containing protein [Treponemataceae bacterium]|nr:DUF4912 domain-containing protein [Treponemataceae bacterium]
MDTTLVTRAHLETLSTADLLALADDYGIDIPEELNRQLIIGELLEAAAEENEYEEEPVQEGINPGLPEENALPDHYNETSITAIMRNPVWCYVYWDISDADRANILAAENFDSLVLRVSFFENRASAKARESYDIPVTDENREQFILVPANELYVRIDLVALVEELPAQVLAHSRMITIPQGCPEISSIINDSDISDIMKISGLPALIKTQYQNHRQSFS